MVVSMIPLDIVEANPSVNVDKVMELAGYVKSGTSLIVLPELFSTGFINNEKDMSTVAEPMDGPTMKALKSLACEKNIAIAGSFLCRGEDGNLVNRAFFIDPDRSCHITTYDKRHLFTLSAEHKFLRAGTEIPPVISFRNWNIALSICFDLRFPVWTRNVGLRYDMILFPANWPDTRFYAWKHLLIARAIENQTVVIGCNRSGIDKFGTYSWLSTFGVNERGEIIAKSCGNHQLLSAEFDLEALKKYREKFPFALSADAFTISK